MTALVVAGGAVVLLAVAIGLGFALFRTPLTGDASAPPSASAIASPSSTPDTSPPSTSPDPNASVIPYAAVDPLLQVTVNGLRMRTSPSTSAEIVRRLDRGEVVRLRGGAPVDADGFAWHEVVDLDSTIGWIAMGSGVGGPWLEAVPAEPATSELLLRLERNCDVSLRDYAPAVVPADVALFADGRVVLGGVVRRLSPAGQAQIQRDVLTLEALQVSATYFLEQKPDAPEPGGHGLCINDFVLGEGADRVVVRAVAWQGQEEGVYWLPAPERKILDELAIHLHDIEAWLGPDAWSEPAAHPFVSSSYQFWIESPSATAPPPEVNAPFVTGAAWPFDGPIEQFGDPVGEARCGHLDLAQAFETLRLMRSLGVDATDVYADPPRELSLGGFGPGNFSTGAGWFSFWLTPRSPDGYPSCSD